MDLAEWIIDDTCLVFCTFFAIILRVCTFNIFLIRGLIYGKKTGKSGHRKALALEMTVF